MKKILTTILLILAVCVNAQHLKFMGIPLDGSIDNFQAKLTAKGITPQKEYNATSAVGSRAFKGIFCGYEASFHTYYNVRTKVVYRSKACITSNDKDVILRRYREIKDMLDEKYISCYQDGEQEGFDSYSLLIMKEGYFECKPENSTGTIDLYISVFDGFDGPSYILHIDYTDRVNDEKNQVSKSNDL